MNIFISGLQTCQHQKTKNVEINVKNLYISEKPEDLATVS